jgi:hypothetical protein
MISFILATILCAATPVGDEKIVQPAPTVQVVSHPFLLGGEVVQSIRADYQAGEYKEFLQKMDADFVSAKKENALEGLIEIRKEGAKAQIHPEFARSYRLIQETKNQQLLDAVKGDDASLFSQKVHSATKAIPSSEDPMIAIGSKAPGSGKNSDENRLIDLDLEYYYKGIHLDSSNMKDRREKHVVLEMEKADRMVKASSAFEDKTLQKAVEKYATTLDERLSKSYDMADLNDLARGKIKPSSQAEKEVASAVSRAQSALGDLHRHLLDSLDEHGHSSPK